MSFNTKYNLGDTVVTIDTDTLKVKAFEIGKMSIFVSESGASVTLYPVGSSTYGKSYNEEFCFPCQSELIDFITSRDAEAV